MSSRKVAAGSLMFWLAGGVAATDHASTWIMRETSPGQRHLVVSLPGPMPFRDAREVVVADGTELPATLSPDRRRLMAAVPAPFRGDFAEVRPGWAGHTLFRSGKAGQRALHATAPPLPPRKNVWLSPDRKGPWAVRRADYDFGDEAVPIRPLTAKGEVRAAVYLPDGASGPRPLVILLHGMHYSCWPIDSIGPEKPLWPCPAPSSPVPSYRGYSKAAELLASHGYAVVSISANAINSLDVTAAGGDEFIARGELVLEHLSLLRRASAGQVHALRGLRGRLDMQRVGLMGHSRGGEGIVRAALLNAERGSSFGIRSLLALAPVNRRSSVPGIPLASVLPYCDGDVTTLEGQAFIDDGAHAFDDSVLRSSVLMMGANHNFYNSVWSDEERGGDDVLESSFADDPVCGVGRASRLSQVEQERLGAGYIAAWFRMTLGGEDALLPLFDGQSAGVSSNPDADVRSVPVLPAEARLDVLVAGLRLGDWRSSGGVEAEWCAESATDISRCTRRNEEVPEVREPHRHSGLGESGSMLRIDWTAAGSLIFELPSDARNAGRMQSLDMRVMVGARASGPLRVTLHDRRGRKATLDLDAGAHAALRPLPEINGVGTQFLQTLQVPLQRFRGIDLGQLRRFEIHRQQAGTLFLAEVSFSRSSKGSVEHASRWPGISVRSEHPRVFPLPSGRQEARVTAVLSTRHDYPVTVHLGIDGATGDDRALTIPAGRLCAEASLNFTPSDIPGAEGPFVVSGNSRGGFTSNRLIPLFPSVEEGAGTPPAPCR